MRRPTLLAAALGVAGLTACGPTATQSGADAASSSSSPPSAVVSTTVPTPSATSLAAPLPTVTSSAAPSTASVDFTMPNVKGMDLQSAQNLVQTHGIFYSRSHDLRGSRHQILDSDWLVCTQNIAAGQRVTADIEGQIDFGVVKRAERCP